MVLQVVPLLLSVAFIGAPVDGTWSGTLQVPGKALRLVFHLTKGAGTVDSPDQNANGIAISRVDVTGTTVRILVPSIAGTFFGTLAKSGNELNGTWKQGAALPLTVKRASGSPSSPEGKWDGVLQTPQGRLRIIFNVKKTGRGYGGTTDSPDQKSFGIPLTAVFVTGGNLHISCNAIHGEFRGKIGHDGKSASGELWQGQMLTLNLKRSR